MLYVHALMQKHSDFGVKSSPEKYIESVK